MTHRHRSREQASDDSSEYAIRLYSPSDRSDLLSLWERIFGREPGEWFDWKFIDNPFLSEVPICVAEHDGRVVGARPSFALPLSVGGRRSVALMQEGAMVHPDHRRRGLYTRMTDFQYDYFADREPVASVGFPNDRAKAALHKLEDRIPLAASAVDAFPMYYRVENPDAIVPSLGNERAMRVVSRLASPFLGAYLGVRDRFAGSSDAFEVERYGSVPAERLASFADDNAVPAAHAARDEVFYRWRFANPRYETETYAARRDGSLVASAIVETEVDAGTRVTYLSDVLPMDLDETSEAAVVPRLFRQVHAMRAQYPNFQRRLPKRKELGGFLREITGQLSDDGLSNQLIEPGSPSREEFFHTLPIIMRFKGSYLSLGSFLERIGRMERLTRVQKLSITSAGDSPDELDIELQLNIYFTER